MHEIFCLVPLCANGRGRVDLTLGYWLLMHREMKRENCLRRRRRPCRNGEAWDSAYLIGKSLIKLLDPSAAPLKTLLSGDTSARQRRTSPGRSFSTTTSTSSDGMPIPAATSSSDRSSSGDVKAAVENIQAMFQAYLENQQRHSSSSSDESTS